jgi:hypothetical protein
MARKKEKSLVGRGFFPFSILSSGYQVGRVSVPSLLGLGFGEGVEGMGFMGIRYPGAGGG